MSYLGIIFDWLMKNTWIEQDDPMKYFKHGLQLGKWHIPKYIVDNQLINIYSALDESREMNHHQMTKYLTTLLFQRN